MSHGDDFRGLLRGVLTRADGRVVYALSGDIDMVTSEHLLVRRCSACTTSRRRTEGGSGCSARPIASCASSS
jgi:hypothetical protein